MNGRIEKYITYILIALLTVSVLVVATLPAVLAWWDKTPYWLLLYLTYPAVIICIGIVCGSAKLEKENEEKRRNSDEHC